MVSASTVLNVITKLNIPTNFCWQVRATDHCQCTLAVYNLKSAKFSHSNWTYLTVQIFISNCPIAEEAAVSFYCIHVFLHVTLKGNKP